MDERNLTRTLWTGIALILSIPTLFLIIVFLKQGPNGVQEWLIPISGFVSLITVAISSLLAVSKYRLSIEAEKRLNVASTIESEIKLLTHFAQMMQIANARYDPILSEKVIEGLFQNKFINETDFKDENGDCSFEKVYQKLELALLNPAYGLATQKAAIGAIYTLGKENPILCDVAIEGLKAVKDTFKADKRQLSYEFIEDYIKKLEEITRKTHFS